MRLLDAYVREAMARGIVDEWHVWDFVRNPADHPWVQGRYPLAAYIPGDTIYQHLGTGIDASSPRFEADVLADNDALFGLRSLSGAPDWEIVLGGWSNTMSVIRRFTGTRLFTSDSERGNENRPVLAAPSPGLLSGAAWRRVAIDLTGGDITVTLDDHLVFGVRGAGKGAHFEVFGRSGWGSDLTLRPHLPKPWRGLGRFVPRREFGQSTLSDFYRYYARRFHVYRDCVFLKCDDDIVYIDLEQLPGFIDFRVAPPEYFLVSANVINNGICAWFQQEDGVFFPGVFGFELPAGGLCGRLWESPDMAARLHEWFVHNPLAFRALPTKSAIPWSERISINFVAWLGEDLVYMGAAFRDDEHDISVGIPQRIGRANAIWRPLAVAHLSFCAQEEGLDRAGILAAYHELGRCSGFGLEM